MEIIGIDLGNSNLKTSEGVLLPSTVDLDVIDMEEDVLITECEGIKYTVGREGGSINIGPKKHKKVNYKVSMLTAIAQSFDGPVIDCNVVVGLPAEVYNNSKYLIKDMVKTIKKIGSQRILVNDKAKIVTIHDAMVFCESAIVFNNPHKYKDEKTLVMDFGGSTVDITFWDGLSLKKVETYKEGMISLANKIQKKIKEMYGATIDYTTAINMIGKSCYNINQKVVDVAFINIIVENYLGVLTSRIHQLFDLDTMDSIQLIGGGSKKLYCWLHEEYEQAELHEDSMHINAKTYKKVGELKWR